MFTFLPETITYTCENKDIVPGDIDLSYLQNVHFRKIVLKAILCNLRKDCKNMSPIFATCFLFVNFDHLMKFGKSSKIDKLHF